MDARVTNIIATKNELLLLSKFIAEVANNMPDKLNGYFHEHYRDWKNDWTKNECDIILIQENENSAQQVDAPEPASPAR
ncbi:MAG: hypothetical protein LVS60_05610 [Nodosilinea sp. LVE1205-7]